VDVWEDKSEEVKMGMHNYRELKVWQRAMDFVVRIYEVTAKFPGEERYGLVSQLRRCAVSIPSNISEGAGRGTKKQFRQFLEVSMGSINEVQTQIELSFRIKLVTKETADILLDEALQIYKMILALYNSLHEEAIRQV
jgi:four helix bundle protein